MNRETIFQPSQKQVAGAHLYILFFISAAVIFSFSISSVCYFLWMENFFFRLHPLLYSMNLMLLFWLSYSLWEFIYTRTLPFFPLRLLYVSVGMGNWIELWMGNKSLWYIEELTIISSVLCNMKKERRFTSHSYVSNGGKRCRLLCEFIFLWGWYYCWCC